MPKQNTANNSHSFRIVTPISQQELQNYYTLRWQLLRAPWQQPPGSEKDEDESQAFHRMVVDADNNVIAVGRLHQLSDHTAQIRYMAVLPDYQGQGIGTLLLTELEKVARQHRIHSIVLDARETVVGFYEQHGYEAINKAHLLFGEIQHYRMHKQLA